jgi:hypothetical protein
MLAPGIAGCMLVVGGTLAPVPAVVFGMPVVVGTVAIPVGAVTGAAVPAVRSGIVPIMGDGCEGSLLHAHAPSMPRHANKVASVFVITE